MTAVIIEDERRGLQALTQMLALHCPEIEVIGTAGGVNTGIDLLADGALAPDLAFMDIQLSDGKVFQLLEKLWPIDFDLIFVTAFDQFAIKACDYASIGYILKPIDPDMLQRAVRRVRPGRAAKTSERVKQMEAFRNDPESVEEITISSVDSVRVLPLDEIIYLQSDNNYTYFHTEGSKGCMSSQTLKIYVDVLPGTRFLRTHRSFLVHMKFAKEYVKEEPTHLILHNGTRIPVSRRRRKIVHDFMRRRK